MSNLYHTRLHKLDDVNNYSLLTNIQRGIEKEGLRVTPLAKLAQTSHPKALGSALTHGSITTDYSEALLEFITPVFKQVDDCIDYLELLHRFTQSNIGEEYLWPSSMPCRLEGENSIPIAKYGHSNLGQMKHIYRQGLAHRYGRIMQSIAGVHYNFSMPEAFWPLAQTLWGDLGELQAFRSERYFGLIRNFHRHSWLLSYLFGASPVLDTSFVADKPHNLNLIGEHTLGLPFATSLRMSDLGYKSEAQASIKVSLNNLDTYLDNLDQAIQKSYPAYEQIGIQVNGEYRQLNTNILQIENEYYSDIRSKCVMSPGEKPNQVLKERGVEYIEVRVLDINPFLPLGIDALQIRFLDTFLLFCLLSDSPEITAIEDEEIKTNLRLVIEEGRKPSLILQNAGEPIAFQQMARQLLDELIPVAELLDKAHKVSSLNGESGETQEYRDAISAQQDKILQSSLTPSARIMQSITQGEGFTKQMLTQAKQHKQHLSQQALSESEKTLFQNLARESLQKQQALELNEENPFEHFLKTYFVA